MSKPRIIQQIQTKIIDIYNDNSIIIDALDKNLSVIPEVYSIVNGKGHVFYFDKENEYNAGMIPFFATMNNQYWVSLSISYDHALKSPKHISISYFNQNKEKMFRAEWASNDSIHKHAQPHWHFHNHINSFSSEVWNSDELGDFFDDVQLNDTNKIERIHFAMSSSWHINFSHDKKTF